MTDVYRSNRKASDSDLIRLNAVGLSLGTIGKELNCHPTTVTLRLNDLNIKPADTRRAFMEGIYYSLSPDQRTWLESQVGPAIDIKTFVRNLIINTYVADQQKDQHEPR